MAKEKKIKMRRKLKTMKIISGWLRDGEREREWGVPRINGHRMPRLPPSSLLLTIAPAGLMLPLCPHPTPRHPNHFGGHMLCLPSLLLPGSVYAPLSLNLSSSCVSCLFIVSHCSFACFVLFVTPTRRRRRRANFLMRDQGLGKRAALTDTQTQIHTHTLPHRQTHTLPHRHTHTQLEQGAQPTSLPVVSVEVSCPKRPDPLTIYKHEWSAMPRFLTTLFFFKYSAMSLYLISWHAIDETTYLTSKLHRIKSKKRVGTTAVSNYKPNISKNVIVVEKPYDLCRYKCYIFVHFFDMRILCCILCGNNGQT